MLRRDTATGTQLCGQIKLAIAVVLSLLKQKKTKKKVRYLSEALFTQIIGFSIILLVVKIHKAALHF